ncbi:MAG: hypothetical protein OSA89_04175 [Mariniblastus sp.]|nr:hypothetical protein [Mariniblastus sp.]
MNISIANFSMKDRQPDRPNMAGFFIGGSRYFDLGSRFVQRRYFDFDFSGCLSLRSVADNRVRKNLVILMFGHIRAMLSGGTMHYDELG